MKSIASQVLNYRNFSKLILCALLLFAAGCKATKPEILVRKWLWAHGYRYRLNVKSVPGKPDIVMRKYRTAIFVNGCFWHGHEGCKQFVLPKTNTDFWQNKIENNRARDQRNYDNNIDCQR